MAESEPVARETYLGIDPGLHGAIGAIRPGGLVDCFDMPIEKVNGKWTTDGQKLFKLLATFAPETKVCVVERAQSMPKQGIASAFNYGLNYGMLLAFIGVTQMPHTAVMAHVWKNKILQGYRKKSDKRNSMAEAKKLFPYATFVGPKGGQRFDRAEALLLAEYGRRLYAE